jgi:hypothetical protein
LGVVCVSSVERRRRKSRVERKMCWVSCLEFVYVAQQKSKWFIRKSSLYRSNLEISTQSVPGMRSSQHSPSTGVPPLNISAWLRARFMTHPPTAGPPAAEVSPLFFRPPTGPSAVPPSPISRVLSFVCQARLSTCQKAPHPHGMGRGCTNHGAGWLADPCRGGRRSKARTADLLPVEARNGGLGNSRWPDFLCRNGFMVPTKR